MVVCQSGGVPLDLRPALGGDLLKRVVQRHRHESPPRLRRRVEIGIETLVCQVDQTAVDESLHSAALGGSGQKDGTADRIERKGDAPLDLVHGRPRLAASVS